MNLRTGARLGFFLLLLAGVWLLRQSGLEKKIWNVDEAVTFTIAQQVLAGDVPYRDAVDQRNPLVPYLQAAVFTLAGDWNLPAQHAMLALLIGLTAALLWFTARALGDESAGVAGALWFVLLSFMLPSVRDTMPAHTAWYLIFFSTAGFWALARAWNSGRIGWAAASGAAFGLSWLAKQPGLLDFGVALVLVALGFGLQPGDRKKFSGLLGGLLAGGAVPVILTGAYFAAKGAWADLVYYTWTYNNTLYVPEVPLLERWQTMRVPFDLAWEYRPLLVVAAVIAAVALLGCALTRALRRPRQLDLPAWLILGWCASGLVSTTLSGRGFTHYSIQLVPGLSLACGWLTARLGHFGWGGAAAGLARRTLTVAGAIALAAWLLQPVPARIRALHLPEPGSDRIAQFIRRQTGARDRIFVWGYTPEIYALSERLPATRFLYCTFLTGLIPWTNLDPLQNTDYAVVPGAWDRFLADWKAHPPALVADGRSQHGFFKYRLETQSRIWPLIERDYAQVEADETEPLGFWLFRRLEPSVPSSPLPAGLPPGGDVQISFPDPEPGQTVRVAVRTPANIRTLELYLDGELYRRLTCPGEVPASVVFFIPAPDWSGRIRRVQVVASNARGRIASVERLLTGRPPTTVTGGPPLEFEGQAVAALESSRISGEPIRPKKEAPDHWDAHAPSRLVYPWLPGMNSLAFAYGIEELALAKEPPNGTDGVEVVVQTEDAAGHVTPVYRHHLDRETARRTRGRVVEYTPLPKGGPGRIILLMTPGPRYDVAFDWSYWLWLRADRSPIALVAGGNPRPPVRLDAPGELRQAEFNGRFITVTDAPASIDFAASPNLDILSGGFGLLDTSWLGAEKTGPVDFAITLHRPDGGEARLFERRLDPVNKPDDRGTRPFEVKLPQPLAGILRFSVRPADGHAVNAHAFWSGLAASLLRTSLLFHDTLVPALPESVGQFGFLNTDEGGRDCLVAHAPSVLVYPWREGMGRLTAEYGIMRAAYNQKNQTEGVVFVVETEDAQGVRREIFRRHLAPLGRELDRGDQTMSLEIPALPGGRLILRTAAPPSGSLNAAWSYWRDLQVAP